MSNRIPTVEQIIKRLGKKRMEMVEDVYVDWSVCEVVLKDDYVALNYCTTMHIFDTQHFEEYTKSMYFDDLLFWFSNVEKVGKKEVERIVGREVA